MLYAKTLEIAEKIGYAHGCARAQEGLADLCEMAGDFDAALELRKRAEKYYADIGDLYRLSYVLESQANTLLHAKRFDQALPYAMRALSNCARLDSKEGMASIQKLLAEIHLELRDFNEAERYWKLFTRSGVALLKPFGPYILGKIRLEQGDLEQAEILIKQSLIAFEGEGQRIRIAYVKRALGRVYARRGDITQARQLLQEALKEFQALDVDLEIKDTQHLLDEVTR